MLATDATRWLDLKEILADALEVEGKAARDALVEQACAGDGAPLLEARRLLTASVDDFDSFAEIATSSLREDATELLGQRVGAYVITRELGRGGMGTVYLGERADGQFRKAVAIKVLKCGTETEEILRRFQTEREILARLEHQNI